MSTPTSADVYQAIWENDSAPNGQLRNARAEELVAAAEQTADPEVVRTALFALIDSYEYSTESGKMLVPFARLLQEWDRDPSAFDASDTHRFHWRFKWVSTGMLDLPDIPLGSIEKWREEMERRYRVAGYTERAVRQSEYFFADETGDTERADRAFEAWCAAERDRMSDCHACELNAQGGHWARKGSHEKALQVWAPVLAGNLTCKEEPHRVLAKSLLPLVGLGRTDEARAHHLRGYRMARGDESLLRTIGQHIEFCALTGNEGRGLEILTEHAGQLGPLADVDAQLGLAGGALVLLGRLDELGHGDRPAATYQGTRHSVRQLYDQLYADATGIARRFDERNGNTVTSRRFADRLSRRPLLDALPLGVRPAGPAAPHPAARGAGVAATPGTAGDDASLAELITEARRLRGLGHPGSQAVWGRIGALADEQGQRPDPLLAAELLEHRALLEPAPEAFERVAAAYRAAGEPGRAAINELWAAVASAQEGAGAAVTAALLETAAASAEALNAQEPRRVRRIAAVGLARIRLDGALSPVEDSDIGPALESFVAAHLDDEGIAGDDVADLVADAETLLAQRAWASRDWQRADDLLAAAGERSLAAGQPWNAVDPLVRRARLQLMLGAPAEAERLARVALVHSAEVLDPAELGSTRLLLAEALYEQHGKEDEAAAYALQAAHWFDAADESAGAGAYARLILAQSYGETGRPAEAAEILESALPDLVEHGEEQAVRARETLGHQLRQLGDQRAAAEQYLLAADVAKSWEHVQPHARLATLAAECLAGAGLAEEAERAYGRALDLWREAGEVVPLARALRSLAWLKLRDDPSDSKALAEAETLMGEALEALAGDEPGLLLERARTWSQLAEATLNQLDEEDDAYGADDDGNQDPAGAEPVYGHPAAAAEHMRRVREAAVVLWEKAAQAYTVLGPELLRDRVQCVIRLAWTEKELGRRQDAGRRLRVIHRELTAASGEETSQLLRWVEAQLKQLE